MNFITTLAHAGHDHPETDSNLSYILFAGIFVVVIIVTAVLVAVHRRRNTTATIAGDAGVGGL